MDMGTCEALELPMAVTMAGVAAAAALAAGMSLESVPLAVIPPAARACVAIDGVGAAAFDSSNRWAAAVMGWVAAPNPIAVGCALMLAASTAAVVEVSGAPERSDA